MCLSSNLGTPVHRLSTISLPETEEEEDETVLLPPPDYSDDAPSRPVILSMPSPVNTVSISTRLSKPPVISCIRSISRAWPDIFFFLMFWQFGLIWRIFRWQCFEIVLQLSNLSFVGITKNTCSRRKRINNMPLHWMFCCNTTSMYGICAISQMIDLLWWSGLSFREAVQWVCYSAFFWICSVVFHYIVKQ